MPQFQQAFSISNKLYAEAFVTDDKRTASEDFNEPL